MSSHWVSLCVYHMDIHIYICIIYIYIYTDSLASCFGGSSERRALKHAAVGCIQGTDLKYGPLLCRCSVLLSEWAYKDSELRAHTQGPRHLLLDFCTKGPHSC